MLVLHSTSACDICLESYEEDARKPHVIDCGHMFCQQCLKALKPQKCPICRATYDPTRIRKLYTSHESPALIAGAAPKAGPSTPKSTKTTKEQDRDERSKRVQESTRNVMDSWPNHSGNLNQRNCIRKLLTDINKVLRRDGTQKIDDLKTTQAVLTRLDEEISTRSAQTRTISGLNEKLSKSQRSLLEVEDKNARLKKEVEELKRQLMIQRQTSAVLKSSRRISQPVT